MLLTSDFNAQTSDIEDITSADVFLSEYFEFDEIIVECFNQKCVLEKYNLQINRVSKDNKIYCLTKETLQQKSKLFYSSSNFE